jgi:hypothetical protein
MQPPYRDDMRALRDRLAAIDLELDGVRNQVARLQRLRREEARLEAERAELVSRLGARGMRQHRQADEAILVGDCHEGALGKRWRLMLLSASSAAMVAAVASSGAMRGGLMAPRGPAFITIEVPHASTIVGSIAVQPVVGIDPTPPVVVHVDPTPPVVVHVDPTPPVAAAAELPRPSAADSLRPSLSGDARGAAPKCTPPYAVDPSGVRRLKPGCL